MEKSIQDIFEKMHSIIGDVPVSHQLSEMLGHIAEKNHKHNEYVTRDEFNALSKQVELLLNLVGDTSVAEQISAAINK